jgi:hypothetical protein
MGCSTGAGAGAIAVMICELRRIFSVSVNSSLLHLILQRKQINEYKVKVDASYRAYLSGAGTPTPPTLTLPHRVTSRQNDYASLSPNC